MLEGGTAPLDARFEESRTRSGATLRGVSYASAGGDRVAGWLVAPEAQGPPTGHGPRGHVPRSEAKRRSRRPTCPPAIAFATG